MDLLGQDAVQSRRNETPRDLRIHAAAIRDQVYQTHAMPPGNVSGITPEERALLVAWFEEGLSN